MAQEIVLSAKQAHALRQTLTQAWEGMFGRGLGDLEGDWRLLADWFGPKTTPSTVTKRLDDLPRLRPIPKLAATDPPLLFAHGSAVIVTPEGRLALEQLNRAADGPVTLRLEDRPELRRLYREWAAAPLLEAIDDSDGRGEPMYPAAMAAVLVLLRLGATSKDRALELPKTEDEHAKKLRGVVASFNQRIARRGKKPKDPFRGYPLSKAKKRLGRALKIERSEERTRTWIEHRDVRQVLDIVASELFERRKVSKEDVETAVAELVAGCAALGSARPNDQPDLASELLRRYDAFAV